MEQVEGCVDCVITLHRSTHKKEHLIQTGCNRKLALLFRTTSSSDKIPNTVAIVLPFQSRQDEKENKKRFMLDIYDRLVEPLRFPLFFSTRNTWMGFRSQCATRSFVFTVMSIIFYT